MEMLMVMCVMISKTVSMMNPIFLAVLILTSSIVVTLSLFKVTLSSWIAFVTILTFSSGMMTLFMYTASLSTNEKSKTKKITIIWMMVLLMSTFLLMETSKKSNSEYFTSMKTFSNNMLIMLMAMILIISMVAIASHGHHPNQTVSTSF